MIKIGDEEFILSSILGDTNQDIHSLLNFFPRYNTIF